MTDEEKELKDQRVVTMMTPSELEAIDDWMFKNRIRSRGEAIRRLCQMGLIFDTELKTAMDAVVDYIKLGIGTKEPRYYSPKEQNDLLQVTTISLLNAKTAYTKLERQENTDEAVKSLRELYAYWAKNP